MGYRSNGTWVIRAPAEKLVAAVVAMRLELPAPPLDDCKWEDFTLFKVKDIGYMRFSYEDWKWYEGYPSVDWYESVWAWCEEHADTFEMDGRRIRIGDDTDDHPVDTFGDGGYDIELRVSVAVSDDEPATGEPLTPDN